jgi:two-component system sensor histidine kinase PilS (NtrC family)
MLTHRYLDPTTRATFWRTLLTFSVTRIVIVLILLVYLGFNTIKRFINVGPAVSWEPVVVYLLLAICFALLSLYCRRRFMLQLVTQITVDVIFISLLYFAIGGAKNGLAILYLFPLAGGAILAPMVLALFFGSVVTLILLTASGFQMLRTAADASLSQAGLFGAAFFAAIFVINRLAAKLIKQEDLAAQRGRDLQMQEAINHLVIADMGDGILVVDGDTEVFAGNPAAERMLGLSLGRPGLKLRDLPLLSPIADAFLAWRARQASHVATTDLAIAFVMVKPGTDVAPALGESVAHDSRRELSAHLKLRFAAVAASDLKEDRTVIFIQNVTEIENQAQQLKLASMGRLTASIAHEVRNPLSAIAHASSLLREEVTHPVQLRLLKIVGDNVVRLNRMIEDILKLSRKAQPHGEPLNLALALEEIVEEFRNTHSLADGMLALTIPSQYRVRFDPLHLREVVANLLSNALRYASGRPGSIRIHALLPQAKRLELHVQDDGAPITPEIRLHLFEPFYTTSSKGTGLGLYVARELCLNNSAMLDYEYRIDSRSSGPNEPSGRFVITFAVSTELVKGTETP